MHITNFQEAEIALTSFVARPMVLKTVYNLETARALAASFDNPQDKLKVLHVAGTSGKTSTAYYTAALLKATGHTVGLTVSPHIVAINDRVQINGIPLEESVFCADLETFIGLVRTELKPTYFELLMVFAYWEFERHGVEYAVIEVGLGGTWDASNIVSTDSKICLITDIGIDHAHILGTSISEIAYWKAGIIQPGNHAFVHRQEDAALGVMKARSREMHAELDILESNIDAAYIRDLPTYQQRNMSLAYRAVAYALERDGHAGISEAAATEAASVQVPGRMEVHTLGDKTFILDGAHNPQKLTALLHALQVKYEQNKIVSLLSFTANRDYALQENIQIIKQLTSYVVATGFQAGQDIAHESLDAAVIVAECHAVELPAEVVTDYDDALHVLLERPEPVVLVTGSLYLVSAFRALLLDKVNQRD